jgi:hypothetical protein
MLQGTDVRLEALKCPQRLLQRWQQSMGLVRKAFLLTLTVIANYGQRRDRKRLIWKVFPAE